MSDKSKGARTRAPNFTKEDQILLFDAMKAYTHIIESKQTDSVKQADKQSAWQKITEVFNSNSVGHPRTTENLIACYRNLKSKMKKQHSDAKMMLVDPKHREALINSIEENGKDWEKVASTSNWQNSELCEKGFKELERESKKEKNKLKKAVMGTGGGPPEPDLYENKFTQLKKFIEPQIDGLFTIYDSDATLMSQYQASLPEKDRKTPIDAQSVKPLIDISQELGTTESNEKLSTHLNNNMTSLSRLEILHKKKSTSSFSN